ncbi:MAG: YbhB/YbcL family Raf kinase inhibitor-like protein [Verrucomicrobiota bacterium]
MKLQSPAFTHGNKIPPRYSRQGEDRIPPLEITEVPYECKSLVLIMDDPDAPGGTFTHCIAYNLEPTINVIDAGILSSAQLGTNSFGEAQYGGPQPPDREHRYFFRLYALDTTLELTESPPREAVEQALDGHILAEASLMGRFAPEDSP